MRQVLMAVAFVGVMTLVPMKAEAQNYGAAGCGLGSMVFGNKGGLVQLFAMTTNATFASQFWGILSGTSNCGSLGAGGDVVKAYVEANREVLAKDMARGDGETIHALAVLGGCTDTAVVGSTLQKNFSAIYKDPDMSTYELAKGIVGAMVSAPGAMCSKLSS